MRHDTQFNLRIVGGDKDTSLIGNKNFAHLPAAFIPDGYVLQVGIGAAQATGGSYRLIERCMYLSCACMYQQRKGVHIGAEQFLQPSLFQYLVDDGMFGTHLLQFLLAGFVLSCFCFFRFIHDFQPVEQHLSYLLG